MIICDFCHKERELPLAEPVEVAMFSGKDEPVLEECFDLCTFCKKVLKDRILKTIHEAKGFYETTNSKS